MSKQTIAILGTGVVGILFAVSRAFAGTLHDSELLKIKIVD